MIVIFPNLKLILIGIVFSFIILYFSFFTTNTKTIDIPLAKTKPIEYFNKILYRGMCEDHPKYYLAEDGIAEPFGGHDKPIDHMHGNNNSNFTSWTTNFRTAFSFSQFQANTNKGNGLMLIYNPNRIKNKVPLCRVFDMMQIAGDYYNENEYLIQYRMAGFDVLYTYSYEGWKSAYQRAISLGYITGC